MNKFRKSGITRSSAVALATACMLQFSLPAHADLVGTGELLAPSAADAERARVQAFVEQGHVAHKLRLLGVDAFDAQERVAAMTQEEIHQLAQRIDTLPAGGALSNTDYIIILLAVILVVIIL